MGGLYVIGTERNDSRRIDNQLRGRAGRQGDPGLTRFFLSLDDNLLRLFGGTKLQNFIQNQLLDDLPLESNILTKSLDSAQKRIEELNYDSRKYLFDYDDILNKQRRIVYSERRKILESECVRAKILSYAEQYICAILTEVKQKTLTLNESIKKFENLFGKSGIELEQNIIQAKDTQHRIEIIEAFLLKKLNENTTVENIRSLADVNSLLGEYVNPKDNCNFSVIIVLYDTPKL